jgi:PAS domain S-box-containing protein
MVDIARMPAQASLRRDAILEAVAFAAERLLLAPEWHQIVEEVLERLGKAADVSRAYVIQSTTDPSGTRRIQQIAEWCAPGIPPQAANPVLGGPSWEEAGFGRWEARMLRGEAIVGAIPGFPESERGELQRQRIRSLAALPIFVGPAWWGCIGFDDCERERDWQAELDALRASAGVLGAAIHRQRSDAEAVERERRYRALVENIPAVTYTDIPVDAADHGAEIGFISPQIEPLLGYPVERFEQDPGFWFSVIHPDDLARLREQNAFDTSDTAPFDHEYRMRRDDGQYVWVHDTSTAVFHADGSVDHFLGFMVDITERKEAERQLALANERFRTIVEQTPAITYQEFLVDGVYDPDTVESFVSPHVQRLLGFTQDELIEPGFWRSVMHPDDMASVKTESDRVIAAGETTYSQDYRMVARDGRVLWFHDESVLIVDQDGVPQLWQGVMVDVTARKEAEERLRAAEERYRALIEHLPAIVYAEALVANRADLYLSPQVERILGYTADDWKAERGFWFAHIHPDDLERVRVENAAANATGEPFLSDYRFLAADGTYRWLRDEAVRIEDPEGEPLFWQGVLLDITEQKQAEQHRRAAEDRFRTLVEHIPAVVYTEDLEAAPETFYISPQVEDLLGYRPEDWRWTAGFWADRIHPDDREAALALDAETNRTLEPYARDYRLRHADGHWVWIHDEASYVTGTDGTGFWQGFMTDITERKEAEEHLREAELKFRTIVEQNQAIFYTQDIDPDDPAISRTTYIAPGNTEMLGYTLDEIHADPTLWRKIVHPDDRERVFSADAESNTGGDDRFSMEYRMIAKDGRIVWVQDEASLVRLPAKPPYWQGFLLDVTERKEAEAQLERALDVEREAAQRLRAVDDMKNTFLQAVSHDLRTPLAAILGLAITLERGDVQLEEADSRDLARRIADNARRLERLVTNLLDMDRLARGIVAPKLEDSDVGALVGRVLRESQLVPEDRLHADLHPVVQRVDPAKVERIVENLLANTVRHAPDGASVWVSVTPAPGGVTIAVEDDGPGIAPELRDAVFEAFRQGPDAPRHSPGVGVGLTLVRRFAELHGGRAWVEEREGGGASFRVFLPASGPTDVIPPPDEPA